MYSKKIDKLHATTPLWKASPHIRILWITLLMFRDERGYIDATIDELKAVSELREELFNDALSFLLGQTESNNNNYITVSDNGIKISCLDRLEQKRIDSMPLWKENSEKGYNEYIRLAQEAYEEIIHDWSFLLELKEFFPRINIIESIRNCFALYWGTEKAWIKRRRKKTNTFNWRETIANTIRYHLVKLGKESIDYELDYLRKKVNESRMKNYDENEKL